jgi:hypothetical protein
VDLAAHAALLAERYGVLQAMIEGGGPAALALRAEVRHRLVARVASRVAR